MDFKYNSLGDEIEVSEKDLQRFTNIYNNIEENNPKKEMSMILDIEPLPYARPRYNSINKSFRNPRRKYYDKLEELLNQEILKKYKNHKTIEGEIKVKVDFFINTPNRIKKTKANSFFANVGFYRPQTRPDVDNYVKPVLDSMNNTEIIKDDNQVVELICTKNYAIEPVKPHIRINMIYRQDKMIFI